MNLREESLGRALFLSFHLKSNRSNIGTKTIKVGKLSCEACDGDYTEMQRCEVSTLCPFSYYTFLENDQLSIYGDTKTARTVMLAQVKKLIEANLLFHVKLTFPTLRSSRLRTLINQSTPDIKMLFTNHTYAVSNGPLAPSSVNQPVTTLTKPTAFPSLGAHGVRNLDV
ncbi:hypothetical protein F2Q68_00013846 [Brassica cretica]|uniref:TPR1-like CTLH-containing domain-containing protein n=1 Tax=Brassica cretica TaxID=69181 RepID=A0A8S9HJK9_BRACR|nr:hypothetical protein F2Q68_00013846 [Brassica cretica]